MGGGGRAVSAQQDQQIAQQLFQQLGDYFSKNIIIAPLIGIALFVVFLWFFHEFREWRLSVAVLASLGATLALMLVISPLSSMFLGLFRL
jgi:hypothetical protein